MLLVPKLALALLLALAVILVALYVGDRLDGEEPPAPVLPAEVAARLDSLAERRVADSIAVETLTRRAEVAEQVAARAALRARSSQRAAERAEARADSIAEVAARDTTARAVLLWRSAYHARSEEADSLRVAVTALTEATDSLRRVSADLAEALLVSQRRVAALEQVNAALRVAVTEAEARLAAGDCQMGVRPFRVRCPSRLQTAGLAVVGWEGAKALARSALRR